MSEKMRFEASNLKRFWIFCLDNWLGSYKCILCMDLALFLLNFWSYNFYWRLIWTHSFQCDILTFYLMEWIQQNKWSSRRSFISEKKIISKQNCNEFHQWCVISCNQFMYANSLMVSFNNHIDYMYTSS